MPALSGHDEGGRAERRLARYDREPDVLVLVLALMRRDQVERLAQAAADALDLQDDPPARALVPLGRARRQRAAAPR